MTIRAERLGVSRRTSFRVDLARYLPSIILAGYGLFILSLFLRQDLTLYINPMYVWPTTLAGAVLLLVAVVRLFRRPEAVQHEEGCTLDSCACNQPSPRLWPYLALSIPLFLAVILPPRSLAAFSAMQRGPQVAGMTMIHSNVSVSRVSLSMDTRSFSLQDWAGALSADPNPRDYAGKPVDLTGMVLHDPAGVPPGYIMVMRYQVWCCIADARPVGLIVRDTSNGALKDNQWVKLTGVMGATSYQGQKIAVVNTKTLAPTKAGNPYMY
jgi:uncharacterized repeat protein (TIGR03943 family)